MVLSIQIGSLSNDSLHSWWSCRNEDLVIDTVENVSVAHKFLITVVYMDSILALENTYRQSIKYKNGFRSWGGHT